MKTHPDRDQLTGYVYRTLDDATRESIDQHLLDCLTCRAQLSQQELRHHQLQHELRAALAAIAPSSQMSFAGVAAQLQPQHPLRATFSRLAAMAPAALSLAGLLLTILGFWKLFAAQPLSLSTPNFGVYPTLACFFFMLASIDQFDQNFTHHKRFRNTALVAGLLWIGSAFIGLLNLIVIRDLAIMAAVALGWGAKNATPIAMIAVYVGAIFYIGFVIGGGEYHYRNIGQPGSWKLFTVTLIGQLFILILPYLLL